MPTREPPETGEIYHVYNRGVDKRKIYMDEKDYLRFIHDVWEFNDSNPVLNVDNRTTTIGVQLQYVRPRESVVEILAFCLMPNHFHLMLRQVVDGGIPLFMQKLGTGYTNSFNLKYKRTGSLFQGRYKFVHLSRQAHLLYLPHYIHMNPLKLVPHPTLESLRQYRWSSFLDYSGTKNYPSLIEKDFLLDLYGGEREYLKDLKEWVAGSDTTHMDHLLLDSVDPE